MGGLIPGQVVNPFSRDKRTHNEDTIPAANVVALSSTEEGIKRLETFSCWTSDAVDEHTRELGLIENSLGKLQGDVTLLRQEVKSCVDFMQEVKDEILDRLRSCEEQVAEDSQAREFVQNAGLSADEVETLTSNITRFGKKATAASDAIQLELPLLKARVRKLEEARQSNPMPTYDNEVVQAKQHEKKMDQTFAPQHVSTNRLSHKTQTDTLAKRQYDELNPVTSKRRKQVYQPDYEHDELTSTHSRPNPYERTNTQSRQQTRETNEADQHDDNEDDSRLRHRRRSHAAEGSYLVDTVPDDDEEDDEYRPNSRLAKEVSPRGASTRGRPRGSGKYTSRYATRGPGRPRKSLPSRLGTPEWEKEDWQGREQRSARGNKSSRGGYRGQIGGNEIQEDYNLSSDDMATDKHPRLTRDGRPDRRGAHIRDLWRERREEQARGVAAAGSDTRAPGQQQEEEEEVDDRGIQHRQSSRIAPVFLPPKAQQPSRSREGTNTIPNSQYTQSQSTLRAKESRPTTQNREPSPANSNKTVEETPEEQEETRRRLEAEWSREKRNYGTRW